jgi:predicted nuclease of predicted toxin-antitoxin system
LNTNLRLLLDEAITDPLARLIRESCNSISVEYVRELNIRGALDENVVAYARSETRIVVTTETGMNHKRFPVCTHPGIIVIASRCRHEEAQVT